MTSDHAPIPADVAALLRAAREGDASAIAPLADLLSEAGAPAIAGVLRDLLGFPSGVWVDTPLADFIDARRGRMTVRLLKRLSRLMQGRVTGMPPVRTLGDLCRHAPRELQLRIKGVGPATLEELRRLLAEAGAKLAGDP